MWNDPKRPIYIITAVVAELSILSAPSILIVSKRKKWDKSSENLKKRGCLNKAVSFHVLIK
jgi:hypothetical protein